MPVRNQPPHLRPCNLFSGDPLLKQIAGAIPSVDVPYLEKMGAQWGSDKINDLARLANRNPPELETHDEYGDRIDHVSYHPAYHALMGRSAAAGLHCSIWEEAKNMRPHGHAARAAEFFLTAQTETGHLCPMTMTNASLAALASSEKLLDAWGEKIIHRGYDFSSRPPEQKTALTIGMGMTEKQGGSDVRQNGTTAERQGDFYVLNGHKWFMSAPMSDAFLVLGQAPGGLSCFLMPRILPDGRRNGIHFQRLKDKLGNRSNGSAEAEFSDALAYPVCDEGDGISTIMEMVALTRLDCANASAALMRAGLFQAVHFARHRSAFGKPLAEQPLMVRVLGDLAIDQAAALALVMLIARSFDAVDDDDRSVAFARVLTPAAKYWICKLAPTFLAEAMECLGGNGYVELSDLPRCYREAPVNAIWEGTGNMMAMDVMRVLKKSPGAFETVVDSLSDSLGKAGPVVVNVLRTLANASASDPGSARILTEQLAISAAAAALYEFAPQVIADSFAESRLAGQWRSTYGMLDARFDAAAILDEICPPAG